MDSPTFTSTKVQQPVNPPPGRNDGPVFVGSERLQIIYMEVPPPGFKGCLSDGIAYFCCMLKGCNSAWAAQWTPTPRAKRIYGSYAWDNYRLVAIPVICDRCKQTIKSSEENRKTQIEACKAKLEEARLKNEQELERLRAKISQQRPSSLDDRLGPSLMGLPTKRCACHVAVGANAVANQQNSIIVNNNVAPPPASAEQQDLPKKHTVCSMHGHQAMQGLREGRTTNKLPVDLHEVPLSPPAKAIEDPAMLAIQDPSWDVISENDANEDWAIINHFGSAAIQHRDAHVDTPTVRP